MKKNAFSIRKFMFTALLLAGAVSLFTACKKDTLEVPNVPVAGLMAFNLTPDKDAVGVDLSNNPLVGRALGFTNYTGGYLNIYPGDRPVKSYNYSRDSVLALSNYQFDSSRYYSLFVVGNNGNYKNIVVPDNFDTLSSTSGKAYVRVVNAIPDSSVVNVTANGAKLGAGQIGFGSVTEFLPVDAGDLKVGVAGNTDLAVDRTISLQAGKAYTVLLVGLPSAKDSTRAVQIRFIYNAG